MKSALITGLALLSTSPAFAASQGQLDKACEELAWKFATIQEAREVYGRIEITGDNQVVVWPSETAGYKMSLSYEPRTNSCLLLSLEVSYR